MKKNGWLVEEFVTVSAHIVADGKYQEESVNDVDIGHYTGRFWFQYTNGQKTKVYTKKTAPVWMLKILKEVSQIGG